MTLKKFHTLLNTLPSGYLVHVKLPDRGLMFKWFIGQPVLCKKPKRWECLILAADNMVKLPPELRNPIGHQVFLLRRDILTPFPPQDLVKYINYLTDEGVEFLKGIKL